MEAEEKAVIESKIEQFFAQFKPVSYKKGALLLRAADQPRGIFYLRKGFVRQYAISPDGVELTVHVFTPGTFFPMMWGLNDIENRYYYEAFVAAEVWLAPRTKVVNFLKREPLAAVLLAMRLLSGINGLLKRLELADFGHAYTRVVSAILYLAKHFGERQKNEVIIHERFTHREIASLVGIARETTSVELEKLMKEQLVIFKDHTILIPNIKALEQAITT